MGEEQKEISETKIVKKKSLCKAGIRQIFKDNGAVRLSEDAVSEIELVLSEIAEDIATRSIELAGHAKRETVRKEDVRIAAK